MIGCSPSVAVVAEIESRQRVAENFDVGSVGAAVDIENFDFGSAAAAADDDDDIENFDFGTVAVVG